MRTASLRKLLAGSVAAGLLLTGCGTTAEGGKAAAGGSASKTAAEPVNGLRLMIPNSPGSGYDTTGRALAKSMESANLAKGIETFNLAGAGGTVGLQRLVNEKGNDKLLMQMGLGVVGAAFTNKSKSTLKDTTAVAKLIEESEAIVVPKNSPYKTITDLTTAWKANPGDLPVGGASNPGGPDHLTPMLLAQAVGLDAKKVNYVSYDGGGQLLAGILGAKVAFGATGVGEVSAQAKSGDVRILAVTSKKRVAGVDAPTLSESGINLEFSNWRGIVAPPGLTKEQTQAFVDLLKRTHDSSEWKQALTANNWTDAFQTGDEFSSFLTSENDRVSKVLTDLGLT